jgi:hypothetical protein
MPGHVPDIPVLTPGCKETWVAGTSPATTKQRIGFKLSSESLKMPAAVPVRL